MKGNRYIARTSGPGGIVPGDFIQFGSSEGGTFDPDIVEFRWGGEDGVGIYLDEVIRFPGGEVADTSYNPDKPPPAIDTLWRKERFTWHLEGAAETPVEVEAVPDMVISSDPQLRLVYAAMGKYRLTLSPEAADELAKRIGYHADRSRKR